MADTEDNNDVDGQVKVRIFTFLACKNELRLDCVYELRLYPSGVDRHSSHNMLHGECLSTPEGYYNPIHAIQMKFISIYLHSVEAIAYYQ